MLAEYDDNWPPVTKRLVVEFEHNSTAIILNLPSMQDWDIIEMASPLIVSIDIDGAIIRYNVFSFCSVTRTT